ncbi:MAG: bifunctional nuclease family protein [Pseudobdellovibrionaceae bacterium]|nr:bifunctional nuclease family protein [Bdellovibrionales bacterium]USN48211.1 MAG: bifunctional nuclease family protein [Pseudobdellovibrionaceae bacterium]
MSSRVECSLRPVDEWIEMFPYGVAVGPDQVRPVMIFKDKTERRVLPVWMSPVDAGIAMSQSAITGTDASPHNLTQKMLSTLGVQIERCYFVRTNGHYQIVELQFSGSEKLKKLESRADEVISFCLHNDVRFFCRADLIEESRRIDSELLGMSQEIQAMMVDGPGPGPYLN